MFLDEHPHQLGVGEDDALNDWIEGMSAPLSSADEEEGEDRDASRSSMPSPMPRSIVGIPMEISPQELRTVEIRESFRGYNREHVDSICERAAETIEQLQRQRSVLEERLGGGLDLQTEGVRVLDAGIHGTAKLARDADLIQRTLLLAQRTADETIADADARARSTIADAESEAHQLVEKAEAEARRLEEGERRRIEAEVRELEQLRDALREDIAMLEDYATVFRNRMRYAVQSELERLDTSAVADVQAPAAPQLREPDLSVLAHEREPGATEPDAHALLPGAERAVAGSRERAPLPK